MKPFEELLDILDHKIHWMESLTTHLERVQYFLVKPRWSHFHTMLEPMEELLGFLHEAQTKERQSLNRLAIELRRPTFHNLRSLVPFLNTVERNELLTRLNSLKTAHQSISRLQNCVAALHWAQAEFVSNWVGGTTGQHLQQGNRNDQYNAQGQTFSGPSFDHLNGHI